MRTAGQHWKNPANLRPIPHTNQGFTGTYEHAITGGNDPVRFRTGNGTCRNEHRLSGCAQTPDERPGCASRYSTTARPSIRASMAHDLLAAPPGFNPIQALPSVFACREIRARVHVPPGPFEQQATKLLAIDPLTTLRCLRMIRAPLYCEPTTLPTIGSILTALGSPGVRLALDRPTGPARGGPQITAMWLHAVATGHAAATIARRAGVPADEAYVSGLTFDLDGWLEVIHPGEPAPWDGTAWRRAWLLPSVSAFAAAADGDLAASVARDPSSLAPAAARLAEQAGFPSPCSPASDRPEAVTDLAAETRAATLAAPSRNSVSAHWPRALRAQSTHSLSPSMVARCSGSPNTRRATISNWSTHS